MTKKGHSEIFVPEKYRNFWSICLGKSKFFGPWSTTPQISNQIDAAAYPSLSCSATLTLRSVNRSPFFLGSLKTTREQVAELWKRKASVINAANYATGKTPSRKCQLWH